MKKNRYGNILAMKEHLLSGNPITRLEAMVLFGIPDLTKPISVLRREGWIIKSRLLPFIAVVKRVNEHAVLQPPKNLPIREIQLTEYWLSK
jgi:hypothetical protein